MRCVPARGEVILFHNSLMAEETQLAESAMRLVPARSEVILFHNSLPGEETQCIK